jgi:hypothetical protein
MSMESLEPQVVYRADRSGYIGFGIIIGLFLSFFALLAWRKPSRDVLTVLALLLGIAGIGFSWFRAFRIEIQGRRLLTYSTLTTRRTISIDAISSVELQMAPFADPWGPTVRLTITMCGDDRPLVINAKVFSRVAIGAVRRLADLT